MDRETCIKNLQIITLLDSISYGMIYGFITPYIVKLGGSHISVGILATGNILAELLSSDVTKFFIHLSGRKYALFFIQNAALVTHLMMVLTDSIWFTILVRNLFSLTNQSQHLCHELILKQSDDNFETKAKLLKTYSILSGAGYIIGPIISGYIFNLGFGYIGILASLLCFFNVQILMRLPRTDEDDSEQHDVDKSVLEKSSLRMVQCVEHIQQSNPEKNWDLLIRKHLFAGSIIVFFSKFTQILKYNFNCSSIVIGYTSAYINSLVFSATYYIHHLKPNKVVEKYSNSYLIEIGCLCIAIFMLLACYAPFYALYLIFLIPVIFLRTFIITSWRDLFVKRNNPSLLALNDTASISAGLTFPLLFGIMCNQIGHNAVILFSCIPMLICWGISRFYSRFIIIDDVKKDS